MTPEQLTLARQFCEAVGWHTYQASGHETGFYLGDNAYFPKPWDWLFTGDGMCAVKAEMTKRGHRIFSGKDIESFGAVNVCEKDPSTHIADSEPEAVLLAAVAAMKAKGVPSE